MDRTEYESVVNDFAVDLLMGHGSGYLPHFCRAWCPHLKHGGVTRWVDFACTYDRPNQIPLEMAEWCLKNPPPKEEQTALEEKRAERERLYALLEDESADGDVDAETLWIFS